ncbi:MAG: glycosyltransferase family 4 protein [Planctomycetota bacterium]
MRIALLSFAVPWMDRPTTGLYNVAQAVALAGLGHDAKVFTIAPWIPSFAGQLHPALRRQASRPNEYEWDGVPIHTVRAPAAYPRSLRFGIARTNPEAVAAMFDALVSPALRRALDEFAPDALVAHGMLPWGSFVTRYAADRGIRSAIIEHSHEDVASVTPGSQIARYYARQEQRVDAILTVSDSMTAGLRSAGLTSPATLLNGVTVHSGIARQVGTSEFTVLCAGQYYERKGHAVLLNAFARANLPSAHLRMVGHPPASLLGLIHDLGLADRVTILQEMPNRELLEEMANADLFALPSWNEAFGLVFAESLGAGTPILMTNDTGFASFVEHGQHGWIIPPRDVAATIVALRDAHRCGPERRAAMGEAGRKLVCSRFSWEQNAVRLLTSLGAYESAPSTPAIHPLRRIA